jgi:exodeoxyribonuclease VIII
MKHITFDLETLGNGPTAPITQIGAVLFDEKKIIDTFIANIELESLKKYNFETDYSTINWWLFQPKEVIDSVYGNPLNRFNIKEALHSFSIWIKDSKAKVYWSHATFDPPILEYAYRQTGLKNEMHFKKQRDIRTLTHFAGKLDIKREGLHHNALDDCIFQAKMIQESLKIINF